MIFTHRGQEHKADFLTIEPGEYGELAVYAHSTYEYPSVLEGQPRRLFIDSFETEEAALAAFPAAEVCAGSTRVPVGVPASPPSWFDPADAGECWHEDDY